ncbi:MAG: hypothetical protein EAX91_02025 [Candidatus Lokiarchaeota archaeon]|nr:hypothetical protein [Candidatus Lokiarchaeota archaeon]
MARTVLLIFAILTLVGGAIFTTLGAIIVMLHVAITSQFPGATMDPQGYFFLYFFFSMGIALIVVSIILFIVRARVKD